MTAPAHAQTNMSGRPEMPLVLALWAQHQNVRRVAKHSGLADLDVRILLREAGVELPRRERGERLSIDVETVVRLYVNEGQAPSTIAQALNVSRGAIYHALETAGVPLRQQPPAPTDEEPRERPRQKQQAEREVKPEPEPEPTVDPRTARVVALYSASGVDLQTVAREIGASVATVATILKAAGVVLRPGGSRNHSKPAMREPVVTVASKAERLFLIAQRAAKLSKRRRQAEAMRAAWARRQGRTAEAEGNAAPRDDLDVLGVDELDEVTARQALAGGLAPDLGALSE